MSCHFIYTIRFILTYLFLLQAKPHLGIFFRPQVSDELKRGGCCLLSGWHKHQHCLLSCIGFDCCNMAEKYICILHSKQHSFQHFIGTKFPNFFPDEGYKFPDHHFDLFVEYNFWHVARKPFLASGEAVRKARRESLTTGQTKFPDCFPLIWGTFLKFPEFSLTGKKGEVIFQLFPDFQDGWEP